MYLCNFERLSNTLLTMQNIRKISEDLIYVGVSDHKLELFENVYPIPKGVSYNSYVLCDEKTVLMDCADILVCEQFIANVQAALEGKPLDYIVVQHMEPDHGATLEQVVEVYPEAKVVTNARAAGMIRQFFDFDIDGRLQLVNEGDTLNTGRHTLTFVNAPMVHWPEVMVTYDTTDKVLFCADAFGTFGALDGILYADEVDFDRDWLDEARRYYINIVGKYGVQVQGLLKKAAGLEIAMLCPLHGPVWRREIAYFVEKYDIWSRYEAEEKGVLLVYGTIYGHTGAVCERLAAMLNERGIKTAVYDASRTHASQLVSEAFRYSHLVLGASTYNNGIFTPIENLLADLKAHNFQNRKVSLVENGSWAPQSGKLMRAEMEGLKNMTLVGDTFSIKSAMKASQEEALVALADSIAATM